MRLRYVLLALLVIIAAAATLPLPSAFAQGGNGITSPANGAVVQGSVQIVGTATLPDFLRYDLHFSANQQDWVYFGSGPVPVINGVLGYWDTIGARIPDGIYTIRLRVVKSDSNYDEFYTYNIQVANSAPPTAAPSPTEFEQPDTPTPPPTSAGGTPGGTVVVTVEQPPTRAAATPSPTRGVAARATQSPLLALPEIGFEGVRDQFCKGTYLAVGAFALIGAYAFLRSSSSWLARRVRRLLYRRSHRTRQ